MTYLELYSKYLDSYFLAYLIGKLGFVARGNYPNYYFQN